MKVVKSKLSISLMSVGFVCVVAGISYAALYKPASSSKPTEKNVASLTKGAPHQSEVEAYLESMKGYLQTPPRDGVFGSDRIPMLHGKEAEEIPAYKDINALEGKVRMSSAVVGLHEQSSLVGLDRVRMNYVHFVNPNREDSQESAKAWETEEKAIKAFAVDIRKSKQETFSQEMKVNGIPSWIIGKAIHASVNSCYKCHTNIKKGEPIGYTVAIVSNLNH